MDTVPVKTEMHARAWDTPDEVQFVAETFDEGNETALVIDLEHAPREVIDALAWGWLNNLYARLQARPPFMWEPEASK